MKAIFILMSILAAIFFASAAKVTQVGNTLVISELKGRPGQTARLTFRNAAAAASQQPRVLAALTRRGL